jgi:hypothetical protein
MSTGGTAICLGMGLTLKLADINVRQVASLRTPREKTSTFVTVELERTTCDEDRDVVSSCFCVAFLCAYVNNACKFYVFGCPPTREHCPVKVIALL